MRGWRWIAAASLAAVLVTGCGAESASETTAGRSDDAPRKERETSRDKAREEERACFDGQRKVRQAVLTLSGWEGPETAGIFMAEKRDYFADAGLTVTILSPELPTRPVRYVVEGMDDIGVVQQPQVALATEKGKPIVAVGSLVPRPTDTMIWLRSSKIDGVADLRGKTIAIPGVPFQKGILQSVLARAGLTLEDVTVRGVGYNLAPELASGRVDAIFGGSENVEGLALESQGLDPVITPVSALGIPPYEELVFIARADCVDKHPQAIRRFLAAVRRGTAAAAEDPVETARGLAASFEANPELSRGDMEVAVKATLPLLSRTGRMSLPQANRLVGWMGGQELLGQGFLDRKVPASEWLTNEYVR